MPRGLRRGPRAASIPARLPRSAWCNAARTMSSRMSERAAIRSSSSTTSAASSAPAAIATVASASRLYACTQRYGSETRTARWAASRRRSSANVSSPRAS